MSVSFVALGANLADPVAQVRAAFTALSRLSGSRLLRASSLYRTAPVGIRGQPDFINAVAALETSLAPQALLSALLAIEAQFGRRRDFPHAPRTLDLDLLLYDAETIDTPELKVPHPRMHLRAFVLAPLTEIAPDCRIPGRGSAAAWLVAVFRGQKFEKTVSEDRNLRGQFQKTEI
ncbi:MAG: 2-amino-4-hydroxy-6-hydroxymethyldihydropteridine diphosphokinase [Candidatus Accumulibacter sp.]|jgi:2-amino-4-hydroxy-6-hydroxymethyldihydropteridine diphosphokinase|nr:2-amino-4-hydroxy-6-hydroxymethyldihydropteridine diphosphokinase [Accumulibacter sp.]